MQHTYIYRYIHTCIRRQLVTTGEDAELQIQELLSERSKLTRLNQGTYIMHVYMCVCVHRILCMHACICASKSGYVYHACIYVCMCAWDFMYAYMCLCV